MRLYILDTDMCIYWLNGRQELHEKIETIGTKRLRTTIITVAELRYGAYKSQKKEENLQKIEDFLTQIPVLPLDREAADRFGQIKVALQTKGRIIGDLDILIAAITLCHDGRLVTNNTEHFKHIEGLQHENWLALSDNTPALPNQSS